jgi:Apea-like HEPN
MHPNSVDLYAGLYGLSLVPDSFELGHGAVIARTYAHFMAPFTMAFAPAEPGRPHPAPWKAAKGGLVIDITSELFLPATTIIPQLDRVNTVWWIVALIRLHTAASISVPVISSERYASIAAAQEEPHLWPLEIHTPRLFPAGSTTRSVDIPELQWLRENWREAAVLLENEDFNVAFQAIDSSVWNHSPQLALVAVWNGLERLFSPSNTELTFRVSANIAAYLEPPGRKRYACFRKVKSLYDSRSKVAHGKGVSDLIPYAETYAIARRVLVKLIDDRHVPSRRELEANLFGDTVGISTGPSMEP